MDEADDVVGRVRAERKRRKMTQQEMADDAGVSLRSYQMFETRKSSPQGENLRAILRAAGMDESAEATAEATRDDWPRDVRVFLDVMGAYLMTMSESRRERFMHTETRRIFEAKDS